MRDGHPSALAADLQHRRPPWRRPRTPLNLSYCSAWISKVGWSVRVMSVIGEILAKCFAIGIVGAGAFVITTYALNNNWL